MKNAKTLTLVAMVLNICLLVALLAALIHTASTAGPITPASDEAASLPPASTSAPQEAMGTGETQNDALDTWVDNMKTLAQKHNVDAFFLQELFPENIVYKHSGQIIYAEVDDTLAQHSYDWAHLEAGEDGVLRYAPEGGPEGLFGIDVSKYQGSIDWEAVKEAGTGYAILRAGYRGYDTGALKPDEFFEEYIEGATAAGIPVGVYFFSQATTAEEAVEEANYLLEAIAPYEVTWPLVFDMEDIDGTDTRIQSLTAEEITDITLAFCDTVSAAGHTPMVYGNVSWFLARLQLSRLAEVDKWFAQYRPQPYYPYEFSLWQYTHTGTLPGIEGDVDFNLAFKNYAEPEA